MAKFHPETEFNQLDLNSLIQGEYDTDGENYSFSKGDHKYIHGDGWFINVFSDDDLEGDIWKIPKVISRFIEWKSKNSVQEFKNEIRNLFK